MINSILVATLFGGIGWFVATMWTIVYGFSCSLGAVIAYSGGAKEYSARWCLGLAVAFLCMLYVQGAFMIFTIAVAAHLVYAGYIQLPIYIAAFCICTTTPYVASKEPATREGEPLRLADYANAPMCWAAAGLYFAMLYIPSVDKAWYWMLHLIKATSIAECCLIAFAIAILIAITLLAGKHILVFWKWCSRRYEWRRYQKTGYMSPEMQSRMTEINQDIAAYTAMRYPEQYAEKLRQDAALSDDYEIADDCEPYEPDEDFQALLKQGIFRREIEIEEEDASAEQAGVVPNAKKWRKARRP